METLRSITTEITVNASTEKVWAALFTRFGEIHLFNPNLEGSNFTKGTSGDVGCERQCYLDSKTYISEKILSAETLKTFSVDVVGGNMPMVKTLRVQIRLKTGQGKSNTGFDTCQLHHQALFYGCTHEVAI